MHAGMALAAKWLHVMQLAETCSPAVLDLLQHTALQCSPLSCHLCTTSKQKRTPTCVRRDAAVAQLGCKVGEAVRGESTLQRQQG